MCDCHPRSKDDAALWHKIKALPRSKAAWMYLHNAIEGYKDFLLAEHRGAARPEQK